MRALNNGWIVRFGAGVNYGTGANAKQLSTWDYATDDDKAAIETSGHFNDLVKEMKVGDKIYVRADLNGTPVLLVYLCTANDGTDVTVAREATLVTGDQTAVAALTDSTTGTADGTVADVGAAFSQATLNNNFAEVTTQLNLLRTRLIAAGLLSAS